MLDAAVRLGTPFAIRYPRARCPASEVLPADERRPMKPGSAEVLAEGDDVVVWAYGPLVSEALGAAERLRRRGTRIGVVDARFAKPLDEELLVRHAKDHRCVITIEEHQRSGGFGSAVLECLGRRPDTKARVRVLGIGDRFVDHMTTREEQLAACGLDAAGIEKILLAQLRATRV